MQGKKQINTISTYNDIIHIEPPKKQKLIQLKRNRKVTN